MPPIVIAAGVMAAGAIAGSAMSASAAKSAGQAQVDSAQTQVQFEQWAVQQQEQQRAQLEQQAEGYAQIQPSEVAAINQLLSTKQTALSASLSSIQKQQDQLDAIDPQVKAAGSDLYNLLMGKSAAILQPMQQQLDRQRQQLTQKLASQMGPGFMTSSAGIEALTNFDQQSAVTINQAQQNAIQTSLGAYTSLYGEQQQGQNAVTSATGDAYGRAMLADQTVLQADQVVANRQLQGLEGAASTTPINFEGPAAAQGSMTQVAGTPYAGAAAMGQTITNVGAGGMAVAGQLYGQQQFANTIGPLIAGTSSPSVAPLSSQVGSYQLPMSPTFGSTLMSSYNMPTAYASPAAGFATGTAGG